MEDTDSVNLEKDKQNVRSFLRERFLRAITGISGKAIEVSMYEKTTVYAMFGSCDIEMQHIQVTDLTTPMGMMPNALLRTSDILSFKTHLDPMPE
jgi:gem associated protein 7